MAILIFLKGQKQPIILREKPEDFRKAIENAYKLKASGQPAAATEFLGWHNKTIWINDLLGALDYATAESDKEIQDQQNEAKKQAYARQKAMEKAAQGGGGGRIMNLSGNPGGKFPS